MPVKLAFWASRQTGIRDAGSFLLASQPGRLSKNVAAEQRFPDLIPLELTSRALELTISRALWFRGHFLGMITIRLFIYIQKDVSEELPRVGYSIRDIIIPFPVRILDQQSISGMIIRLRLTKT